MRARHLLTATAVLLLVTGCSSAGPAPQGQPEDSAAVVEAPDVLVIGHRGAMREAPENTVPAFEAAMESGADMVEIDVQLSADGQIIVFHDDTPDRTTNVDEVFPDRVGDPITSFTWEELQQLDAGSHFQPGYAGTTIPNLADVAATVGPEVGVDIELKEPANSPGLVEAVAEELTSEAWAQMIDNDLIIVSSFDEEATRAFHQIAPDIPAWVIMNQIPDQAWVEDMTDHATGIKTSYQQINAERFGWAQDAGLPVWAHTVNTVQPLPDLVELGVSGIVTDSPWLIAPALGRE